MIKLGGQAKDKTLTTDKTAMKSATKGKKQIPEQLELPGLSVSITTEKKSPGKRMRAGKTTKMAEGLLPVSLFDSEKEEKNSKARPKSQPTLKTHNEKKISRDRKEVKVKEVKSGTFKAVSEKPAINQSGSSGTLFSSKSADSSTFEVRKPAIKDNIKIKPVDRKNYIIKNEEAPKSEKNADNKTAEITEAPPVSLEKVEIKGQRRTGDRWAECGQIYYTAGKAYALTPNLRTICLGTDIEVEEFLNSGKSSEDLTSFQKEILENIKSRTSIK